MSVKRRAAADLNHENWDKEEKNEEIGTFKTAPGDVLEKRVFRLAKRRSQNVPGHESKKPVFSGFGGFNKAQPSSFDFLANLTKGANTTAPITANSATLNVNASDMKPFGSNIFTPPTSTSSTALSFGKIAESASIGKPPDADSTVNENLFKSPVSSGSTTSGFKWKAPENSQLPSSIFGAASSSSNNKSLFASNTASPFQIQTSSNNSQIKLDTQNPNQTPQLQTSQTQGFQFQSPTAQSFQFKAPPSQSPQFKAPITQSSQFPSPQSQSSLFQAQPTTQIQTSKSQSSLFQVPQPQTSQLQNPQSQTSLFQTPQAQTSQFQSPQSQTSLFQPPQTQSSQFQSPQSQTSLFQPPQSQTSQFQSPQSQTSIFQAPTTQTSHSQSPPSQTSLFQTPQTQASQFQTPPAQSSLFQTQNSQFKNPQSQTSLFQAPQPQTTQSQGSKLWPQQNQAACEKVTQKKTEVKTSEINTINMPESKLNYYIKLKGLNESVLEWIKKHVDETPVCILTPIFKDYEKYINEIQNEYENSKKEEKETTDEKDSAKVSEVSKNPPVTVNNSVASLFAASVNAPKSIFSSAVKSTTQTPSFSFGFTSSPSTNTTSSGFTFGVSSTQSTSTTSSPFAVSTSNSITNGQPFSFGTDKPFSFNSNIQTPQNTDDTNENAEENDEPPKVEFTPVVEENSVFDKRCKIFTKKDNNFVDNGVGTLYIKKINDSEKHQLLVRANTSLGNILLNLVLSSSIPTQRMGKNNVMLVCIPTPEAKPPPVPILIRVKTSEEADDLLSTLDKYKA